MGPSGSVKGFAMRGLQETLRICRIEAVEQRAVMQDGVPRPPLCAAGYLSPLHGQVTVPLALQARHGQRLAHPAHDPIEAVSHIVPFRFPFERQYQRVIQTSKPQQHRAATGAAPQDGNVRTMARGYVDIALGPTGLPQYNAFLPGLPEPQYALALMQQFLVETKLCKRAGISRL